MKRAICLHSLAVIVLLLSGCIINTTPDNKQTIILTSGETKTFTISVFPTPGKYVWSLDGNDISGASVGSYVYSPTFNPGEGTHTHSLKVKGGSDSYTWVIQDKNGIVSSVFNKLIGGVAEDRANSVLQSSDGNYVFVGSTYSYGGLYSDVWLVKLDTAGNTLWKRTYDNGNLDSAKSFQQTSDGGFIIAAETYCPNPPGIDYIWLIKTDENGIKVWDKIIIEVADNGTAGSYFYNVQQTVDGGYILALYNQNIPYLIKTDANGNILWDKSISTGFYMISFNKTDDGGYILAGRMTDNTATSVPCIIKTGSNGDMLWGKRFADSSNPGYVSSVQQTSDGGYILGITYDNYYPYKGAWICKTDSSGNLIWESTFGSGRTDDGQLQTITQTSDGGYIALINTSKYGSGMQDVWIIKIDPDGNKIWDRIFGGNQTDGALSIKQTNDGGYVISGWTYSFGAQSMDAWIIKTDAEGNAPATPTP